MRLLKDFGPIVENNYKKLIANDRSSGDSVGRLVWFGIKTVLYYAFLQFNVFGNASNF